MNIKTCKYCKNVLPVEDFYVSYISSKEEKIFEAFHYSNTRPLEITLNRSRPKTIKHG